MVDELDRALFAAGMIDIKAPDVWGQNRMTRHRDEFERTMYKQLGNFQEILQAAQRRADIAAMTSATALSFSPAAPAAAATGGSGLFSGLPRAVRSAGLPLTPVVLPPSVVNNNLSGLPAAVAKDLAASSITLPGSTAPAPAPARHRRHPRRTPTRAACSTASASGSTRWRPTRSTCPRTSTSSPPGRGSRASDSSRRSGWTSSARYINHLHELRRVNAGDDLTDMAGYGLYLLRLPVSLMPGPASRKGKGAVVTMEARHDLTPDLLENTFRDVVVTDATYALTRAINDNMHATICEEFQKKHQPCDGEPRSRPTGYQPNGRDVHRLAGRDDHDAVGNRCHSSRTGPRDDRGLANHPGTVRLAGTTGEVSLPVPTPVPNHYIDEVRTPPEGRFIQLL